MSGISFLGIVIGFGSIILGQHLEGGSVSSIINGPAFLIVMGGSIGAVLLGTPSEVFFRSIKFIPWAFAPPKRNWSQEVSRMLGWVILARKEGLLGLESAAERMPKSLAKKGLFYIIDGAQEGAVRSLIEQESDNNINKITEAAKVYESLSGYTPTIGIVGAVLGLIQVMKNLQDPSALGNGIAVAFVATIYGVAFANLLFLPMSSKLRSLAKDELKYSEMLLVALIGILEGENPRRIEERLRIFVS